MHHGHQQQPRVFCFTDFPCCHPLLTCGIFDSTPFHVCAARPLHSGSEHVLPSRGKTLCEKLSIAFLCQWYLEVAPGLLGQDTSRRMKSELNGVAKVRQACQEPLGTRQSLALPLCPSPPCQPPIVLSTPQVPWCVWLASTDRGLALAKES